MLSRRVVVAAALAALGCKKKPPPRAPVRTVRRPPPRTVPAATVAPKPAPAPAASPQQLGPMLSPEQKAQQTRAYQQSAKAAEQSLAAVMARPLTREQMDSVNRIRSLLTQAQAAQARDIAAAAQLARRAELLAQDLAAARGR